MSLAFRTYPINLYSVGLNMIKLATIALLAIFSAAAPAAEPPLSPVCWPLNFAGITLGVTTDSQVQRLLGKGVAKPDEGDTGGRYFIDPQQTATLHVVSYTDAIVGEVTVEEGAHLSPSMRKAAISRWFDPKEQFGNWHQLHLGSSKHEVLANLGTPPKGKDTSAWEYPSACACELPVYFTIYFKNDRIYKVVFSAPAG